MSLLGNNTLWILWSPSPGDSDERHILDISFGLLCLESRGVLPSNIKLIIDGSDENYIKEILSIASSNNYIIYKTSNFDSILSNNFCDNLVVVVTGHGSIEGISATENIKPYPLVKKIKNTPKLKCGILVLGQCFAGVFNYMNVKEVPIRVSLIRKIEFRIKSLVIKKYKRPSSIKESKLIIIGATNLYESKSFSIKERFLNDDYEWAANIFLVMFFKWIKNPVDIDGDGIFSLMDVYKYSGSSANKKNTEFHLRSFLSILNYRDRLFEKIRMLPTGNIDDASPEDSAELIAISERIRNDINITAIHQESWILNAIPAQKVKF